ncbi:MAG TPA: GNAT family N-acetyltransferase, partial [Desulfurivibrionaceae bacterium]|nr:GNAT family N-acetyltransferase [Desulfurivibrionaceae bacterium]
VDGRRRVAFVAEDTVSGRAEPIALASFGAIDDEAVELALVVRDEWQNRRIGSFLFRHLVTIAKRNGISGFTAEVLRDNRRMQTIFNHSGYRMKSRRVEDVYSYEIDFD